MPGPRIVRCNDAICEMTGAEACRLHDEAPYDLILMDVAMPLMDGVAATKVIRDRERQAQLPRVRIVGVTANAMTHQIRSFLAAGMDDVVAKPIRPDRLLAALAGREPGALERSA